MDKNIVISISRKYGCGGRELAQILAEKLNIKLYDRNSGEFVKEIPAASTFMMRARTDDAGHLITNREKCFMVQDLWSITIQRRLKNILIY